MIVEAAGTSGEADHDPLLFFLRRRMPWSPPWSLTRIFTALHSTAQQFALSVLTFTVPLCLFSFLV